MTAPKIELSGSTALRPGMALTGAVHWDVSAPPSMAELRLVWRVRSDAHFERTVVRRQPVAALPRLEDGAPYRTAFVEADPDTATALAGREARWFAFTMPEAPYSFVGTLFSLVWTVELSVGDDEVADSVEITLSASGEAIRVSAHHAGDAEPTARTTDPEGGADPPWAVHFPSRSRHESTK